MMDLGNFHLRHAVEAKRATLRGVFEGRRLFLSPMAGVTDMVFRELCVRHGADFSYCEFVSADGVLHGNKCTRDLMELAPGERNVGIQLFGANPERLAAAAREAATLKPTLIDLNFGCPVKKVVKKNGGSALLCDTPLVERITRAVVAATELPVTAKIRLGWSTASLNYMEVCQLLEEAGVCAITIHGRTRDQLFHGTADWTPIAEVKAKAAVPIIGNGDVWSGEDYRRMRQETGCDAVMVARAAIGNPFIFEAMRAADAGQPYERPEVERVVGVILEHLDREIALKGYRVGLNRMKRHFSSYLKGYPAASELRKRVFATDDRDAVVVAFEDYRRWYRSRKAA
jgi:nifR3 family TIM-barrel protein